jgi:hypothetical protein
MKRYSIKFWLIFWSIAVLFLAGWLFYWQTRFGGLQKAGKLLDAVPFGDEQREEYKTIFTLANYLSKKDDIEKTFLVLFQNNLEIRPGGGFIGSFGILKIKNGEITDFQTHDTGTFDARIPDTISPPYPMKETLRIKSWKMRDSNWSPDFPTNVGKAEEFYFLGKGEEKFDGTVGVTSNVLTSFLKATGPIEIAGYPGTYDSENAIISLEYQVEKGYAQQGIGKGERKSVMNLLAQEILTRVSDLSNAQKLEMAKIILEDLRKKDIQFYFKDPEIQKAAEGTNWIGKVDENWSQDYLMIVDANLGAYKSDYYVKRSIDYYIDLSKETPEAKLRINYNHTAKQKDWMTNNYQDYLRVYGPAGLWLNSYSPELPSPHFAEEFGKKYFGFLINVPIGQEKAFEFNYTLPQELKNNYDLKIQKQAGINDVPVSIHVTYPDGNKKDYELTLNSDVVLSEL